MSKHVLIVEDEPIVRRNLASALERAGLRASTAPSVAAAHRVLTQQPCDLICLDIQLEDGDGLEFMTRMRATQPSVPVVVMSGRDSQSNRSRAESIHASAFLAKPFALSRFQDLVVSLLSERAGGGDAERTAAGPLVMMYSHDTIGMGHLRRNAAIAAQVVATMPEASVLMLVGCPAGVVFDLPQGVDFIKLPALVKVSRDVWRPGGLRITADATRELRCGLIDRAVETFRPDVLLVDHEPAGVWDELVPVLERLRAAGAGTRVMLGLRDILDEPERTRESWAARAIDGVVRSCYDHILVYGDPLIYPSSERYGLETLAPDRVHYCGYVTSAAAEPRSPRTRLDDRPRLLVAGGGGRDAFPMMHACMAALEWMAPENRPEALIVTGPLMDQELREDLAMRADRIGVTVRVSENDFPLRLRDADHFVTMGGYNSMIEALAVGCPTLVIPRVGPSREQQMRADMFAARGFVQTLSAEDASPQRLAELFAAIKPRAQRPPPRLRISGAADAAALITRALQERHPQTPLIDQRVAAHA
ncbi:MAG: response regulator [Alphaproteobacteria bacterium]